MPVTAPNVSEVNLTPTSADWGSPESATGGVTFVPHIEQGQETLTLTPAEGVSRFELSSTARDLIVVEGFPCAIHA